MQRLVDTTQCNGIVILSTGRTTEYNIIKTVTEHKNLQNGSIVLMHNGAKYTAQALPKIIEGLRAKGYELVPISELIYRDNYHLDVTGRQIQD